MITSQDIDLKEALRYMGHRGSVSKEMEEMLLLCQDEVLSACAPKYIYRSVSPTLSIFRGKDIKSHLEGCFEAVLVAGTLGIEVDKLIKRAEVTDMQKALFINAIGSSAIEGIMNKAEEEIQKKYENKFFTFRFSPGYGDFPIEVQKDFLSILDGEKRIGVHTDESSLLIPSKSVTAVIGVSHSPIEKKRAGCANCKLRENCKYRKNGDHCGN
ncbi:MAG: hypothetical protein ACI4QE_05320 [Acutalibacteraceae bacterium]